jgi:ABC-type multidrug transport system ATPase subunit
MGLLELEHVSRCCRDASRVALDDVSLAIDQGEMVVVWGERRSGRSSLLRVAAGIQVPDSGVVRFAGRELTGSTGVALGNGISFCRKTFCSTTGRTVLDHMLAAQLARRVPRSTAIHKAASVLQRVGAAQCATLEASELSAGETVRVAIARGLCSDPLLLVIDEPTIGVDAVERDEILLLLRSLADGGIAVLASAGEGTGLLGADRVLSIGKGRLRGELEPTLAPVTDLDDHRRTA